MPRWRPISSRRQRAEAAEAYRRRGKGERGGGGGAADRAELKRLAAQLDAERAARDESEKAAAQQRDKLEQASKTCKQATEECSRVRRRNEQLEREVETLRQRLGEGSAGSVGLGDVYDNLESMEQIMMSSDEVGNRNLSRLKRAMKSDA